MRTSRVLVYACAAILAAGCGGGGGGGGTGATPPAVTPPPPPPPPAPSVQVAITSPAVSADIAYGDEYQAAVSGTWSGANLGSAQVYLQVSDNAGTFVTPAPQLAPASNTFSYSLPLVSDLAVGTRTGILTVRACQDTQCTQPYANASSSVTYQIKINPVSEWEMTQGNASHDGYVPITLNPARFAKAWEWRWPLDSSGVTRALNAVSTGDGAVYVTGAVYHAPGVMYALNESSGSTKWTVSFGTVPDLNPPAFHGGQIYVATTGHESTFIWSFDAATGQFRFKSPFSIQWGHVPAPTVFDNGVYTQAGYYGGVVYAFDRLTGAAQWQDNVGGGWDGATPAVDQDHVYHHSGERLVIWNRTTGVEVASISDPFGGGWNGYDYNAVPMLGGRGNVIAYAGLGNEHSPRVLSSFDIAQRKWEWATADAYVGAPAVANGVIYALRKSPMALHALDETTGRLLWSWTPTAGQGDMEFRHNVVATRNLLLVSTDRSVYAVDIATRQSVWRYPEPGRLALSAGRTLYIATTDYSAYSNGKLVAVRLR